MNDLQKTEFELLKIFIEICDKLELKYYLVCGSALGAVKYGGFIPWDDDIDVAMIREDYETFCEKAPYMLPEGKFLQNYHSEPECPFLYSKLRNSNTTYIEKSSANLFINHGMFIDIFPIDGYPKGELSKWWLDIKKSFYKRQLACVFDTERNGITYMIYKINRFLRCHKRTNKIVKKLENVIIKHSPEDSAVWCNHGNDQGKLEYATRNQYGDGTWATFEGLRVRVPEDYDAYLTQKYGDWKKELPEEQRYGHHYYTICDANKSYKQYIHIR